MTDFGISKLVLAMQLNISNSNSLFTHCLRRNPKTATYAEA